MNATDRNSKFDGSIPEVYERFMVPLFFEPYAADLAERAAKLKPTRVLEIAAGTGVLARRLAEVLPADVGVVATDLHQAMLDLAATVPTARPVEWRRADALNLPFEDEAFDLVVCQFGVMFFPDRARAFSEARRVLRGGGHLLLSVWDRAEANEFADTVTGALAELFPDDPPRFIVRVPHGYHDPDVIARDLRGGGFERAPEVEVVAKRVRAASPTVPAVALCQGTPLRTELEARGPDALSLATTAATAALKERFGEGAVESEARALVVHVVKTD